MKSVNYFIYLLYTDKCSLISCQNGGTCEVKYEKAVCTCTDEYIGDYCEKSE